MLFLTSYRPERLAQHQEDEKPGTRPMNALDRCDAAAPCFTFGSCSAIAGNCCVVGVARPSPAGCDGTMPEGRSELPLLRLGRLELGPDLRALHPGQAASGLVVTAMIQVPDSVVRTAVCVGCGLV